MIACRPAALLFFFLASLSSARSSVTDGLVHHWNFDQGPDWHDSAYLAVSTNRTAFDCAGQADATLQNMDGASWVSGRQFTGLLFDGIDDYLATPTNLAQTLGGTASLSLWLQTRQSGTAASASSPGVAGRAGSGAVQWGWLDVAGRVALSVDGTLAACSSNAVNDGSWHHVVLTRDSDSGRCAVYLDGAPCGAGSGPAGIRGTPFSSLGRIENAEEPRSFAGRIDQIHLFNKVLSAEEVSILRSNHAPKCWPQNTEGSAGRAFSTASLFFNTFDVERDALSVTSWSRPSHGSTAYNGDGSFTYAPDPGFSGADGFTAIVSDGRGGFCRAAIGVKVVAEPEGGEALPVLQYTGFSALQANGADISHAGWRIPRVFDWSADGKLDLLIGAGGYIWAYVNSGTTSAPAFGPGVKLQSAGSDIYAGTTTSPFTLADMTGDGVADLVLADSAGKLRLYRNTAGAGLAPVLASPVFLKRADGSDFILPDRRFDLGDWNRDGAPDLVTGTYSGDMKLFINCGTAGDPRFDAATPLLTGAYQLYPRLYDLDGNGLTDFLRGINWGDITYWRDAGDRGLASSATLAVSTAGGASPDLHALTDGAIVDFGDFTGDGKADIVIGGHAGDKIYLATGVLPTAAENIAQIEAIYDANAAALGAALSANTNALLNAVNRANLNLASRIQHGTPGARATLYAALTNHIAKYAFLRYQTLDTNLYHQVPSIVIQNWVMLTYALADTPARRAEIADVMGLSGTVRTVTLESGLALGDNGKSLPAVYGTLLDFMRRQPRELFPDALLTIEQLYGDGRGGFVWTPNSTKNTFGNAALGTGVSWSADLMSPIESILGAGSAYGEGFSYVLGHEVTHALDSYVSARANKELKRRWGLMLCAAAGPDVIAGSNGWRDVTLTKAHFLSKGFWDGNSATWTAAWSNYWATGSGAAFRDLSFMRGQLHIDWFLDNPQESLATQANQHWANGVARLIGACDRFRRASGAGLGPLRANINEVVTFIDFLSAGMNRVNLVETEYQSSPQQVNWHDHFADLERDDRGSIRKLCVDGRTFVFDSNADGVVTNVATSILLPTSDTAWTFKNTPRALDLVANDSRLEGGPVVLLAFTQPAHGSVTQGPAGTVIYTPQADFLGADSFSYTVSAAAGGDAGATVTLEVVNLPTGTSTVLVEYWGGIAGNAVSDLTASPNFPSSPTARFFTNSAFEVYHNYGDNYGARYRTLLVPSVSGDYKFWIASDDSGELWFSTNSNPAAKARIAYNTSYASYRQWTKFTSQRSSSIPLVAGRRYYMEALQKEGTSGDHLSVAWAGPSPYSATNVIPADQLANPYAGYDIPSFSGDPLTVPDAQLGTAYSGSLSDRVSGTNASETLRFFKLAGPAWLSIGDDGQLSGLPPSGSEGTNTFSVRVCDSTGFFDDATLTLRVCAPAPSLILPGLSVSEGLLGIQFTGTPGLHYHIEFTPALTSPGPWQVVADIPALLGTPMDLALPATNACGFYRIRWIP